MGEDKKFKKELFKEIQKKSKNSDFSELFESWSEDVYSDNEVFGTRIIRSPEKTRSLTSVKNYKYWYPSQLSTFMKLRYCKKCGGVLKNGHACVSPFGQKQEKTAIVRGNIEEMLNEKKKGRSIEEIQDDPRVLQYSDDSTVTKRLQSSEVEAFMKSQNK